MKINCEHWKKCELINGGCCALNKYAGKPSYKTCITVCEEYNGDQNPPPDLPVKRFILPESNIKDFGLGDLIFYIFKFIGVNYIFKKSKFKCKCEMRRNKLNEFISYRKILEWLLDYLTYIKRRNLK